MCIIECRDLTKGYGAGKTALAGVDLTIESGRIVGLIGPNGAGKTTLLKLAAGLLLPDRGEITINGMAPGPATKAQVAYLPDRMSLPPYMKVETLMKFYADFFRDFNERKAIDMFRSLEIQPDMRVKEMSLGTKQKVQLVLCMARDAQAYLLDEPLGGVDPASRDYILRTIIANYNPKAAVVISTHLIADVEPVLDEVVMLKQGSVILHQNADELRSEKGMSVDALFREVFKC